MTIELSPESVVLVQGKVQSGLYQNAAEVVERALELLREQEQAEEQIEALLQEDIDSGESTEMTTEDWDGIREEVRRIHAERRAG
jgi:antitoxin ParD1/3/4